MGLGFIMALFPILSRSEDVGMTLVNQQRLYIKATSIVCGMYVVSLFQEKE